MTELKGEASADGVAGVLGISEKFNGVLGFTKADGHSGVAGVSDEGKGNGVYARSKNANGVIGYSSAVGHSGVAGVNDEGDGPGVYGRSAKANGVRGESSSNDGVIGITKADGKAGVAGVSDEGVGNGVCGRSKGLDGVIGISSAVGHSGVAGANDDGNGPGVYGRSKNNNGVYGESASTSGGAGIWGKGTNGARAAVFEGDVEVTGDIRLTNADCAEQFDIAELIEAESGTVMVLSEDGSLRSSNLPYDKRVVGVVSGAGDFRPGIILDQRDTGKARRPVALLGKVYCKVDAECGPVAVGDLLTTSATPGHAMKVTDPMRAFGAVIGKALGSLRDGCGLVPILIALQ